MEDSAYTATYYARKGQETYLELFKDTKDPQAMAIFIAAYMSAAAASFQSWVHTEHPPTTYVGTID